MSISLVFFLMNYFDFSLGGRGPSLARWLGGPHP